MQPPIKTRFDELAVFVAVAEAGSISAAARRLGVPKSTVGRAIGRIEEQVGVTLVRRLARGHALTDPGRSLSRLAAPHVAALRDATAALGREASEAYGLIRMTAPADIGTHLLAPVLASFLASHPRVSIEIEHTLRVVDLVREGVDLAIRVTLGRLPSSALVGRPLASMNLGFYAAASHAAGRELPRQPADLTKHEHVCFSPAGKTLALEGPKGRLKVTVEPRAAGNDFFFVREAVAAGIGIGLLPWFLASREVAAGRIVRVLPEYRAAGGTAYLVYPPAKPLAPKLARLCRHLLEHVPALAAPQAPGHAASQRF
jgi:DNA-binding transcriptional LysR family regulator